MITDLAEIWVVLAVPFVVGCLLGSLLYRQLSFTRLAPIQNAIVGDVASFFGGMRRAVIVPGRQPRARKVAAPPSKGSPPPIPPAAPSGKSAPPAPKSPVEAAAPAVRPMRSQPSPAPLQREVAETKPAPAPRVAPPAAQRPASVAPPEHPVADSWDVRAPTPDEVRAGRPPAMLAPRDGRGDDLRRIRGIGESYEARLHGLGIFHFDQIAAWSLTEAAWIAMNTGAGDRVVRYDWIGQARALAGLDNAPPEEE